MLRGYFLLHCLTFWSGYRPPDAGTFVRRLFIHKQHNSSLEEQLIPAEGGDLDDTALVYREILKFKQSREVCAKRKINIGRSQRVMPPPINFCS